MSVDAPSAGESTSAPSLMRSGALSLATSAAPLLVALVALPVLTRQLGPERLGLLALAWAWLGYAALLDFGLGRALTRMVAAADAGETLDAPVGAFVATAHATIAAVGIVVGGLGAAIAPWYVRHVLHVSDALRTDAIAGAVVFALTVPLITVPAGFVADLLPIGLTFLGPSMSEPTLIGLAAPVRRWWTRAEATMPVPQASVSSSTPRS